MDTFTETVPMLDDGAHDPAGRRARAARRRRAALGDGYDTELRSFVNVIATPKGGTHLSGFERGVTKTVQRRRCAPPRCSRSTTTDVVKDDVLEG
jgi:DNA gyrase subunit B